ncbi:MAG: hypothetical protein V3U37_00200 [Nitrospinaceae bacterium]
MNEPNPPVSEDPNPIETPESDTPQEQDEAPELTDAPKPSPFAELEREIDLNVLYPDAETNLNELFPEREMKRLLKSINKNKKDLHRMRERFCDENEVEDDEADEELDDGQAQELSDD